MEISVGTYSSVRYLVVVHYWECPLIESPLYTDYSTRLEAEIYYFFSGVIFPRVKHIYLLMFLTFGIVRGVSILLDWTGPK